MGQGKLTIVEDNPGQEEVGTSSIFASSPVPISDMSSQSTVQGLTSVATADPEDWQHWQCNGPDYIALSAATKLERIWENCAEDQTSAAWLSKLEVGVGGHGRASIHGHLPRCKPGNRQVFFRQEAKPPRPQNYTWHGSQIPQRRDGLCQPLALFDIAGQESWNF